MRCLYVGIIIILHFPPLTFCSIFIYIDIYTDVFIIFIHIIRDTFSSSSSSCVQDGWIYNIYFAQENIYVKSTLFVMFLYSRVQLCYFSMRKKKNYKYKTPIGSVAARAWSKLDLHIPVLIQQILMHRVSNCGYDDLDLSWSLCLIIV